MLGNMFGATDIPVLEELVNFSQARHNVLAGNIANIDVPGYRTRDLSIEKFQARLKRAIESRSVGAEYASPGIANDAALEDVSENMQNILYHDESNVGVEEQVTAITKNQMQHNLALTIMNSQFRLLQAVVSERA